AACQPLLSIPITEEAIIPDPDLGSHAGPTEAAADLAGVVGRSVERLQRSASPPLKLLRPPNSMKVPVENAHFCQATRYHTTSSRSQACVYATQISSICSRAG